MIAFTVAFCAPMMRQRRRGPFGSAAAAHAVAQLARSKAGEFFYIPAGVIHDGKNVGSGKARVLANYIVRKGEPVSSPAK